MENQELTASRATDQDYTGIEAYAKAQGHNPDDDGSGDTSNNPDGDPAGTSDTPPATLLNAMKSITIENEKAAQMEESEAAQQQWVDDMTATLAKNTAYDSDTFKKLTRLADELFREKVVHPLNGYMTPLKLQVTAPDKDVYVIVIAADNLDIPKGERLTQDQVEKRIKSAFEKEFSLKQGWRMMTMSVFNSMPMTQKFFQKNGLIEAFTRMLGSLNAQRAAMLPTLFKTKERPNRLVPPTRKFQPAIYTDVEIY